MTSHRRLSPGVEFNEIDRSQYGQTDYSVTGTATHIAGFADIGQDYVTKWINSRDTFYENYGYPTNEIERYFFNGVCEIIDRGGVAYATKLPYANKAKDKLAVATYSVGLGEQPDVIAQFEPVDSSLTSYLSVKLDESVGASAQRIDLSLFDDYRTGKTQFARNKIKIVDITGGRYGEAYVISGGNRENIQCLGVVPVLVGSANSMFFKGLISSAIDVDGDGKEYS